MAWGAISILPCCLLLPGTCRGVFAAGARTLLAVCDVADRSVSAAIVAPFPLAGIPYLPCLEPPRRRLPLRIGTFADRPSPPRHPHTAADCTRMCTART